ncbi:hypothetical protein DL771_009392 [Monosporascus sp. 5C6A]|nr:hypothetical protein DL771_009392 [Monosporascus sp. 5C6A]
MPRSKNRNRNYARGLANRQKGIFKKSNTFNRFYGGDIAVVIKQHGRITAYESRPGILNDVSMVFPDESFGPDDFDTIADRQSPQAPGSTVGPSAGALSFDLAAVPDAVSAESPMSSNSSTSSVFGLHKGLSATPSSDTPNPSAKSPQMPMVNLLSDDLYYQGVEQDPDFSLGNLQDYIFPSALLPAPSDGRQGQGSVVSFLASDVGNHERQQPSVLSPKPISPQYSNDVLSMIEKYFGE